MSLLEESPVSDAPVAPAASDESLSEFPSGSMDFIRGQSDPVMLSTGSDDPVVPTPSAEEPSAASAPEPTPDTAVETPPPFDWTAVTAELTAEDMDALVKTNPQLKRRLYGELGSRLQQREKLIREEAAKAARAEVLAEEANVAKATSEFEEVESWQDTDPGRYQAEAANNPAYLRWKADYQDWAKRRAAPPVPDAPSPVNADALYAGWNGAAVAEARSIMASTVPWYSSLPAASRQAIENVQFRPDGNWVHEVFQHFTEGTKAHFEGLRKHDIEQARIAGRNEALAELKADRPVMTSAPPAQTRTPLQVITAHAFGEKVSPQELQAAYKARGI